MQILFPKKYNLSKKPIYILEDFIKKEERLVNYNVSQIVEVFSIISKYWSSKECKVSHIFANYEMGFLIAWLKKNNINNLLEINFKEVKTLDIPQIDSRNTIIMAKPRGIALHWLAGNVPVLGVISLFQSILTKNKTIVKVPMNFKMVLPEILNDLRISKYFIKSHKSLLNIILDSIIVLYVDKKDLNSQEFLSQSADIRVAWGGFDGISAFLKLPKKINCRDIVFGPKVSFAIVKKEKLRKNIDLLNLAKLICDDIIPFNQMGCNSPHNLIIEKGSKFSLNEIGLAIHNEFKKRKLNLKFADDPLINFNILTKKFLYQTENGKEVISGNFNNWNIFINKTTKIKIEDPLFKRNIHISEIRNLYEISNILPNNTQSIGLFCNKKDRYKLMNLLSNYNVDRFPELGKMSLYQNPWDGYLPLHDMVKWISSN
tara:strand:- start:69199 stop:70488 length:1290 start_codon:yes stop_codon:yes gene_type:complete